MEPLQFGLLLCAAATSGRKSTPKPHSKSPLKQLAPAKKLRFGVVNAPERTAFFVVKDADGNPSGVPADLARALAQAAGLEIEFRIAPNSGELTEALAAGEIDAAFMPVDEERRKRVDFGPVYFVFENTYLVRGDSDIESIAAVDRQGVRVIGIAGTTTIRSAARQLRNTMVTAIESVDAALNALKEGKADAFALTRDSLPPLAARVPGSRILDGAFQQTGIAIALPKNRPDALAYVSAFMEQAKASGLVRKAFDDAGLAQLEVAPPAEAS